ncbi:MAG: hypothetical protein HYS59_01910 [Candidatus Vogelbacteria bacterium]|nr:hypothetical protein [Candidatus Vogelbacteria bacterium]
MTIVDRIARLRRLPEKERRNIAWGVSLIIVASISISWIIFNPFSSTIDANPSATISKQISMILGAVLDFIKP